MILTTKSNLTHCSEKFVGEVIFQFISAENNSPVNRLHCFINSHLIHKMSSPTDVFKRKMF